MYLSLSFLVCSWVKPSTCISSCWMIPAGQSTVIEPESEGTGQDIEKSPSKGNNESLLLAFFPAGLLVENHWGDGISKPAHLGSAAPARCVNWDLTSHGWGSRHEPYTGLLSKISYSRLPVSWLLSDKMVWNNHLPIITSFGNIRYN